MFGLIKTKKPQYIKPVAVNLHFSLNLYYLKTFLNEGKIPSVERSYRGSNWEIDDSVDFSVLVINCHNNSIMIVPSIGSTIYSDWNFTLPMSLLSPAHSDIDLSLTFYERMVALRVDDIPIVYIDEEYLICQLSGKPLMTFDNKLDALRGKKDIQEYPIDIKDNQLEYRVNSRVGEHYFSFENQMFCVNSYSIRTTQDLPMSLVK